MLEAVSLTLTRLYHERAQGNVVDERGANLVDGGAPFYNTYETADGRHVAVGAVERKFYAALLGILGLDPALADTQWDRASWPRLRAVFAERFRTAPRDAWTAAGARVDACVSPVLSPGEAVADEHNRAVDLFTDHGGVPTPRPLARFSVDVPPPTRPPARAGDHTGAVLAEWGITDARAAELWRSGAIVERAEALRAATADATATAGDQAATADQGTAAGADSPARESATGGVAR